jgi:hypothetical protein
MPTYRNTARELAPGYGACERFDRDQWVLELERPKDPPETESAPTQPAQKPPKASGGTKAAPYTQADMPLTRGLYDLVRIEPNTSSDRSGSHVVVGRCRGPKCGGRERRFTLYEWAGRGQSPSTAQNGCTQCTSARRQEQPAEAAAQET